MTMGFDRIFLKNRCTGSSLKRAGVVGADLLAAWTVLGTVLALGMLTAPVPGMATPAFAQERSQARLNVPVLDQEDANWAWVAVAEMVMRHYKIRLAETTMTSSFQCQIAASAATDMWARRCAEDCLQAECDPENGSAETFRKAISLYSLKASRLDTRVQPRLRTRMMGVPMTPSQVTNEIDGGHPLVAVLEKRRLEGAGDGSTAGAPHFVMIIGYRQGGRVLVVNDPYPFLDNGADRYTHFGAAEDLRGSYLVPYQTMRNILRWRRTIRFVPMGPPAERPASTVPMSSAQMDDLPRYCCTDFGKVGPIPNPGLDGQPLTRGDDCAFEDVVYGFVKGKVCK